MLFFKRIIRAQIFFVLILTAHFSLSQTKVINGSVSDQRTGAGLQGVTVTAKGTTVATQTGSDGTFSITVPSSVTVLVFSSVGFETREETIAGRTTLAILLVPANEVLGEVVVTGYGSVRRKDLTSAITTVSSKDFVKGPITTPEGLLNGKVAGVQITSGGGAPGAGTRILIRGGASLSASNAPLIVIDGVPVDNNGIAGAANPLSLINPNDIESVNILKDASATSIYGNRASNGVIIITTKKGKTGKLKINFSTLNSVYTVAKTADVLSPDEFRAMVTSKGNPGQQALLGNANTDWQDQVYRTAFSSEYNVNFTGGISRLPYRFSIGYLTQEGILITGELKRLSGFLNLSPSLLNNHLRIDLNLRGATTDTRFANEGAIGAAAAFDPTQPVYNNTGRFGGYFEWLQNNQPYGLAPRNPVGLLMLRKDISEVERAIGNIQFDYKFHGFPDLRANLNLGFDKSFGEGTIFVPDSAGQAYLMTSPTGQQTSGVNNQYEQEKRNVLLDFFLNYTKNIGRIQSYIDVMAGYGYQDFLTKSPSFPSRGANGVHVTPANPFPFETQNTLISVYGRLRYTFMNRYLLTANVRYDGSSRFNPDVRWKTFPGVSLAWILSEESFLKGSPVFSNLKLRLGYGETGQQDIGGDYPYIPRYTMGNSTAQYQFGNTFYSVFRPVGYDANIKWEETSTYNVGIDFGLLRGRLSGSIDGYYKKTEDLLSVIPVPAGTNFTNEILTNVGNMENYGVEFSVSGDILKRNKLNWNAAFNLTYNKNKITKLTKVDDPTYQGVLTGGIAGGVGNTIQIHSVGYPRSAFYVLQQVYNADGKPIEGLYVDRNEDGVINNNDYYRYKSPEPDVFMGLTTEVTYENWTFGTVLRASIGNYMYNNRHSGAAFTSNSLPFLYNVSRKHLETNFANNQYFSDLFIENASYLKMDNISATYNFGRLFGTKATLKGSLVVQNVFTVTKYSGVDPEIAGGIDNNFYTRPRVFALGFNLDL
jgi:TonB-linked SusC/RagA family outer membrane protein